MSTATAHRGITHVRTSKPTVSFTLSLVLPDLAETHFETVEASLLKIEYLGTEATAARTRIAPLLDPHEVIRRWVKQHKKRPDLRENSYLRAFMMRIPLQAARSLRASGIAGARVAQALGIHLNSPNVFIRQSSVNALIGLEEDAACVLGRLVKLLADTKIRLDVISTIGWLGPQARQAVPPLERIALQSNKNESEEALHTLLRIGVLPRSCFPRAFGILEREATLKNAWTELIFGTAKRNAKEFDFVSKSLLETWSEASIALRLKLLVLLELLVELSLCNEGLSKQRIQLSNEIALLLIGDGNQEIFQKLNDIHRKLDDS